MSVPAELHYTPEHEWVSIDGTTASVGITEYAAQQLGDVVYVSLPAPGTAVTAGRALRRGGIGQVGQRPVLPRGRRGRRGQRRTRRRPLPGQRRAVRAGWLFRVRVPQDGDGKPALPADLLSAAEYEELTKSAG